HKDPNESHIKNATFPVRSGHFDSCAYYGRAQLSATFRSAIGTLRHVVPRTLRAICSVEHIRLVTEASCSMKTANVQKTANIQGYGDDPLAVRDTGHYKKEYAKS